MWRSAEGSIFQYLIFIGLNTIVFEIKAGILYLKKNSQKQNFSCGYFL